MPQLLEITCIVDQHVNLKSVPSMAEGKENEYMLCLPFQENILRWQVGI